MNYEKLAASINAAIDKKPDDIGAYSDLFSLYRSWEEADLKKAHAMNKTLKNRCVAQLRVSKNKSAFYEQWRKCLLFDAPHDFDSYLTYMELNRQADKRFYQPRRKQLKPVVDALQAMCGDDELDLLAVSLPPGVGKALANDTPILTKTGWKKHGELTVGDEVIGMDGCFKKVIAVHPKCQLDVLVEFTNGEKIQCHENHEWLFYNRHSQSEQLRETKEWARLELETGGERGKRGHRYMLQVPPKQYVVGEDKRLPLDPYVFGVWLGDGANKNPRIAWAKGDYPIMEEISRRGYELRNTCEHKITGVMYSDLAIRKALQTMGMCHSRIKLPKHIPDEYFTASISQRLGLLAGLLDTDGTLCGGSKYTFSTTSEELRDAMITLVSTFGWRACLKREEPKVSSSGIHGRLPVYIISFSPDIEIPCQLPRKKNKPVKQRKIAVKSISKVEPKEGNCITVEGGMYLAGKTLIPTHNTTLAIFLLTWIAGRDPNHPNLTGSHSNSFIRGVYDECLRLFDAQGEYLWHDVFPAVQVTSTNAKDCRIDLDKRQRFETLEFTSIGTGNAGLYRAANLLYCDDLISGIEVALSKERLDKLWETYATDLRQRKIGDKCKELHIATRWSVHDVIGRLEREYEGNPRAKFIRFPAMDENDESNFDYDYGVGFSTKFYREQRDIMDAVSWKALYMNQPIEREGLLYHEDELRRYFDLPEQEPDAIIAVCDTKDKGTDYCAMPIAYQYGDDYYIEDFVCDNSTPEVVEARLVSKLLQHRVQAARFESNSAGGRIAADVQKQVKEQGGRTKITTKFSTANKETRIIIAAGYAKEHFLFKDESVYKDSKEYRLAMSMLCGYTMAGKNKNDDIPDSIAMLVDYSETFRMAKVEVMKRPF